jgi:hypothetical protein
VPHACENPIARESHIVQPYPVLPLNMVRKRVHVVQVPLRVNAREAAILDQRLRVVGQLRNAGLQELLRRARAMRRDPDWQVALRLSVGPKRTRAFSDLRHRYGLQKKLAATLVFEHWRASHWMGEVVDGRTALALGAELLQNVDEWLFGRAARPRFKKAAERGCVWGTQPNVGLCLRDGKVSWRNAKTPRKNLELELDLGSLSQARRADLAGRTLIRSGIRRELVRGKTRYFALLCVVGQPYRSAAVHARMAARPFGFVGVDFGPSLAAAVGPVDSHFHSLASQTVLDKRASDAKLIRCQQRALDRSRRAANPDCYDERGRTIKGKHPNRLSTRGVKLQARLTTAQRRSRINRLHERAERAKQIMYLGTDLAYEAIDKRNWQHQYGKRVTFTAPGALRDLAKRECELFGGRTVELLTWILALSQHCLCGARVKKARGQKIHSCPSCGLGPLDRDLFSAYLARLCAETGVIDLDEGPFNTAEHREEAIRLCGPVPPARRAPSSRTTKRRIVSASRAKHVGQTPEQELASVFGGKRFGRRPTSRGRPLVAAAAAT